MITLVPWILSISVVEWEGHNPESIEKLRAILDKEFEYEYNELSTSGYYEKCGKKMVEDWVK
jgi:hypothetical protein